MSPGVVRCRYAGGSGTEHPIRDVPFRGHRLRSHGSMSLSPRPKNLRAQGLRRFFFQN